MKLLLLDIDTLRADHLGCYGYARRTSPNIDSVAADGMAFSDYYCSDAPCLPSRAAAFTGKFGIHTGVVGHGGTAADMRLEGKKRNFFDMCKMTNLPAICRLFGMYPVSFSTFAERHAAWWYYAGFQESYNVGKNGDERADEVFPAVLDWLKRNRQREDWFLHVHFWDPHTMYRTPEEIGNPFEGQSSSSIDWIDDDVFAKHKKMTGFHNANEVSGYDDHVGEAFRLRQQGHLDTLEDVRRNVDGYDCGIYYADMAVGRIVALLKEQGIYEETAIIVTADHGEDMGELGRYSEHGCADYPVTRLPFILKWPGIAPKKELISGFHYNVDLIPTLMELLDAKKVTVPFAEQMEKIYGPSYRQIYLRSIMEAYDGKSFADSVRSGEAKGREYLVLSCATHAVQRAVRFDKYLYIRTYHDGLCQFPQDMLFDLETDPHQQNNLAQKCPELVYKASYYLSKWVDAQMYANLENSQTDPLWTVMAEGGGFHFAACDQEKYLRRLEETGRGESARVLRERRVPFMESE